MFNHYDLTHKDILCVAVDWNSEPKRFVLVDLKKNEACLYHQVEEHDCSADTDHIRCVINEFLEKRDSDRFSADNGNG